MQQRGEACCSCRTRPLHSHGDRRRGEAPPLCVPPVNGGESGRERISGRGPFVYLLMLLACALPTSAQQAPYQLGPGDVVGVLVFGEEELSVKEPGLPVGPDGRVGFPGAGMVEVAGKTCDEVAAIVRDRLTGPILDPQVTVSVLQYNARRVSVVGAVKQPGVYPHVPGMRVIDALAAAGGLVFADEKESSASMRARLLRPDRTIVPVDLREAMAGVGESARLEVQPGDTLLVERVAAVSVLGYVLKPGNFEVPDGCRLSEALARAGGVDEEAGDLRGVVLTHADGTRVEVDAKAALEGQADADIELLPGDVVYVPRSAREANVVGYVRTPGRFKFLEGEKVSSLIARAGGVVLQLGAVEGARGDLARVSLSRADGTTMTLDLTRALGGVEGAEDPLVQPGDVVFVPEERLEVAVFGHVVKPGRYRLRPGDTVLDLLAAAGGPIRPREIPAVSTAADLAHCTLQRASGETIALDLSGVDAGPPTGNEPRTIGAGDASRSARRGDVPAVTLEPFDVLYVPEAHNRVLVSGYVGAAGYFEFRPGETVRTALGMGGGIMPNVGSETVEVRHSDGTTQLLDTSKSDLALAAGDEIHVPFMRNRVAVVGYVTQPGFYEWHEGDTVIEMIAAANGIALPSIDRNVRVIKGDYYRAYLFRRENGEDKRYELDLKRFYEQGDQSVNMALLPDDIIMVPKISRFDLGAALGDILSIPRTLFDIRDRWNP